MLSTPVPFPVAEIAAPEESITPCSTASVDWMVVGERKDQHMIDTDWTDENGRVIIEPLKS